VLDWTFDGTWPYAPRWFETGDGRMHYVGRGAAGQPAGVVFARSPPPGQGSSNRETGRDEQVPRRYTRVQSLSPQPVVVVLADRDEVIHRLLIDPDLRAVVELVTLGAPGDVAGAGATRHPPRQHAGADDPHSRAPPRSRKRAASPYQGSMIVSAGPQPADLLPGPARLPIHYPNPRDLPVNTGKPSWAPAARKPLVCRRIRVASAPHALLAMQKVEGSNPFSRFRKGRHLQVFFV
jgi:hypothetical protein